MGSMEERDIGMVGWLGFQLYRVALGKGLAQRGFSDLRDWDGNLLRYLQGRSATVMEVARLFGVTKQAASQQIASFVERGYGVRVAADGDARVRAVALSERGRAARRAAIEIAGEVEAQLVARLGSRAVASWRKVNQTLAELYLTDAAELVRVAAELSSATPDP
jgi:DNA-binding MarR family transcriptional regulator